MYVIKHTPEDFAVEEVSTVQTNSSGKYLYFKLWKEDVSTMEALRRLSMVWHIPLNSLSCAGNKDKKAITEQTCGAYGIGKDTVEKTNLHDIKCTFLGYGDEPVHLGQLEGNKFKIVLRNLDETPKITPKFRNLFGEQRFSTNNADIGRHIVKREFKKAADLIVNLYPQIQLRGNDYVGALRKLPRKLLMLFVHAYQSLLWNKAAMLTDKEELPIVGFGTENIDEITQKMLEEEKIKPADFIVRELPEASAEGTERKVWAEAKELKIGKLEEDECFPGKKKITIEFFLPKGSYATEFIRACQ
ncbi:MAG: tRNA pseudouridine(13) synthase TruD [Candidatus Woesearchaeota archaeon]|nr:tRNA pseudouridine(13) synthase TruD [Candidatus Woesearchaeota archaeon]